jgi:peptide/nickel transport system ATP-binding protein
MCRGEVVESGPADEILDHPGTDYAKLLLSSVPEMKIGWLEEVTRARESGAAVETRAVPGNG